MLSGVVSSVSRVFDKFRSGELKVRDVGDRLLGLIGIHYKKTWSQCGEDIIVKFIFDCLGWSRILYMDIGAHHPKYLNNTYLFYLQGANGVNIEPDPRLFSRFDRARRRDINVNAGVGPEAGSMEFYVMSSRTLNTFSKQEADRYVSEFGFNIQKTCRVDVRTFSDIVDQELQGCVPDFVSLDVEGMDLCILQSIDFSRFKPVVFCIETLSYAEDGTGVKNHDIDVLMKKNGYFLYADTYINSIYVLEKAWRSRRDV